VVDFEIAEKYKLDKEQIIDKYGKLLPVAGEFAGMKIKDAREKIIEKLASKGLVEKIEDYTHNIATAERTDGIIEPQIMNQWFVDVNKKIPARENKSLKELMIEVIKNEEIKLFPEYFDKTYYHWIENLRDWCISRQIWYGHRIPVWYNGSEVYCGTEAPSGADWTQDEDTLDTWFSSGMWSFSTLGWPNEGAKDLQTYHPTTTLVTAYEILFFWVARMIMMSKYALGDIPFKNVYLTGVVRDAQGRKLSKSLGNGIDPLDVAEKFGMDAGRMALITGGGPGTDSKIDENKIKGYKNFANKLWNITRFILSYQEGNDAPVDFMQSTYEQEQYDAWRATLTDVTSDIENFRLHLASEKLYHYAWHSFADIILEDAKTVFLSDDQNAKNIRFQFLITLWKEVITALHPFIPFVTEEIWSLLPKTEQEKDAILMVSVWPSQRINKQ
jgi:valyl-tRNA synthetase